MKLTANFFLEEFVPKHIWLKYGDSGSLWFIDYRIVLLAQKIRDYTGAPGSINTWHMNGQYDESGYRDSICKTYRPFSQHSFGRAMDYKCSKLSPPELAEVLIKYHKEKWPEIGALERTDQTPTWNHIDLRKTIQDDILIVDP